MSGKLFLICPTDFIEQPIKQKIKSDCFFYTALGLNFDWDLDTVQAILSTVEQHSIDDIVFVTDFRNKFYSSFLNDQKTLHTCASVSKIAQSLQTVEPQFYFGNTKDERMKVLASKHILEQQNKLKKMLAQPIHYKISAFLFDKKSNVFLNPYTASLGFDIHLN